MAIIEILGNPMIEFEKNEIALEIEQNDLQSYWEWEANLLREEVLYFEDLLRRLKNKIDAKVSKLLAAEVKKAVDADLKGTVKRVLDDAPSKTSRKMNREEKIRNEVEAKYAD